MFQIEDTRQVSTSLEVNSKLDPERKWDLLIV